MWTITYGATTCTKHTHFNHSAPRPPHPSSPPSEPRLSPAHPDFCDYCFLACKNNFVPLGSAIHLACFRWCCMLQVDSTPCVLLFCVYVFFTHILFGRFAHVNRSRFASFSSLLNSIPARELAGFQNNRTHMCVSVYSFSERGFACFRLGLLQNHVFFQKAFKLFSFFFLLV